MGTTPPPTTHQPPPPPHTHTPKMQAVASFNAVGLPALAHNTRVQKRTAAVKAAPVRVAVRKTAVVCKASSEKKAAVASAVTAFTASPAFAIVDERLNGDGVGYPLGISDPTFFWVIFLVFTLVWSLFYTSSVGGGETEDDGLSL